MPFQNLTCPPVVPRLQRESGSLIVVGIGLGKRAACVALRLLKRPARFGGCQVAQRRMRPDIVIVIAPDGQFLAGIREAVEDLLIQALVTKAAVEAFNQAVLLRLAGVDVMPGDAGIARLLRGRRLPSIAVRAFEDRGAGELGAIIADNAVGSAVNPDHRGQLSRNARAREAGIGDQRKVLSGAVVDDS